MFFFFFFFGFFTRIFYFIFCLSKMVSARSLLLLLPAAALAQQQGEPSLPTVRTSDLVPSTRLPGAQSAVIGGESYTLTPGGWFVDECVHAHGAGRAQHWPDHVRFVERRPTANAARFVTDVVDTASGAVIDTIPECTHPRRLLRAVQVVDEEAGTVRTVPVPPVRSTHRREDPALEAAATTTTTAAAAAASAAAATTALGASFPSSYEGWQTYTSWKNPGGDIASFVGLISTPMDDPAKRALVVYIFTGLQNTNWIPIVDPEPPVFDIIQPVLQYPGGLGDYWAVRSWYVSLNAGALASKEVRLEKGDEILGNMTRTGPSSYAVVSTNRRNGEATSVSPDNSRLASQPWAYVTLETYGARTCDFLPKTPSKFTSMALADASGAALTPQWALFMAPKEWLMCPTVKCDIISPSDINIDFVASASN
jgi:hypothetical protein